MDVEDPLRVPLLSTLPRHRLEELARELPARYLEVGQVIAWAGDFASHLIVLERGCLTSGHDTPHGTRVRLATVTAPAVVDKAATLNGGLHTATWTASTRCRVRLLPAELLRQLILEEPSVREHVLRYLSEQVNKGRRSRVRRADRDSVAQVADWLAEATFVEGRTVELVGGQQGLGEELGLSRVTVNRALQKLVAAGAIQVRPRIVNVLDAERLATAALSGRGLRCD